MTDRWRETLDAIPQMVWAISADGAYYNKRWLEFTGWDLSSLNVDRLSLVYPEDRERAAAAWQQSLESVTPYECEYRLRHHSGEYRWIVSRGQPQIDPDGPTSWYGTCTDVHERVVARRLLEESERRTQDIIDSIPQVIWSARADGLLDFVSAQWHDIYGATQEDALGEAWLSTVHPEDQASAAAAWSHSLATGMPYETKFRLITKAGNYRWALVRALPKAGPDGKVLRWYGTCTDIDPQVIAQEALRESELLCRGIIEATPNGVSLLGRDGTVLFLNDAALRAGKASRPESLLGKRWTDSLCHRSRRDSEAAVSTAQQGRIGQFVHQEAETGRWWDVVVAPVRDDAGMPSNLVVISRDITGEKAAEEKVRWAANHDTLTTLPNRFQLQQRIDHAIVQAFEAKGGFALLLLDIDHFKQINDTLGHDAGDELLRSFAERLTRAARPDDTVGRLGGDEFAIVLAGVQTEEEIRIAVESILSELQSPCLFGGRLLDCQASIGASIYPFDGATRAELLKNADVALYAAKGAGRGCWKSFRPEMREEAQRRFSMLSLAKSALDRDRIIPYYQPKIELLTGQIAGFEALLRWKHPKRGIQAPATIAAAFDDATLAAEISDRMIDKAVEDIRRWRGEGVDFKHVAINAAAAEFRRGNFAERLLEILSKASVPTSCLQVEVTETVFLGRGAECVERALKLLSLEGVKIALDDFGTGYASLSHLKQFPVDYIKIDRSFVADLPNSDDDGAIIKAVINLGRSLGIEIIAEGVETMIQHGLLTDWGCAYGQGYLYRRAASADRVPGLLRERNPLALAA
jgi:diguanylate cyclase (GGDEF)-like protein/PAS domain S-box-containing protein